MTRTLRVTSAVFLATAMIAGCSGSDLTDEQSVELIFDAFQPTIAKIVAKGYEAKDAPTTGANITTPLTGTGDIKGTMTVGGKVAQSGGGNQNFTLWVQLDGPYADDPRVSFQTDNTDDTTKLQFPATITNQPADNRMSSTVNGRLDVTGDVAGGATFAINVATDLDDNDAAPTPICSHVTGTVTAKKVKTFDFVLPLDTSTLSPTQLTKCQGL